MEDKEIICFTKQYLWDRVLALKKEHDQARKEGADALITIQITVEIEILKELLKKGFSAKEVFDAGAKGMEYHFSKGFGSIPIATNYPETYEDYIKRR